MGIHQSLDPCEGYKNEAVFSLLIITMAKLHGFVRPMDIFTAFDGSVVYIVPRQKPIYARQLAMEYEYRPDPPIEYNRIEYWPYSYDIPVTVSTTSILYE